MFEREVRFFPLFKSTVRSIGKADPCINGRPFVLENEAAVDVRVVARWFSMGTRIFSPLKGHGIYSGSHPRWMNFDNPSSFFRSARIVERFVE